MLLCLLPLPPPCHMPANPFSLPLVLERPHCLYYHRLPYRLYSNQPSGVPDLPLPVHSPKAVLREESLHAKGEGGRLWWARSLG